MAQSLALSNVLANPSTIKFLGRSDDADLGDIDLSKNPQKTPSGPFVWMLPDRSTEASVTFIGKVIYSVIGDKTGPYFSLPEAHWMPDITPDEMAKAKVGFAVRFINRELTADALLPDALNDHNQAALEFFLTVQEAADERLGSSMNKFPAGSAAKPVINKKPFLKIEDGNPFYVLPVISAPLFPQFKGPRTPGVVRAGRQQGRISLNPAAGLPSTGERDSEAPQVLFYDLVDPKGRFAALKANQVYHRYEMCIPPVFTGDGSLVAPSMYEAMIPDGTLVAVRGKMKMYDILSRDRLSINRPYVFIFDRLQVVDGFMDGWDGSGPQSSKKRLFETGPAEGSRASKWRVPSSDEELESV